MPGIVHVLTREGEAPLAHLLYRLARQDLAANGPDAPKLFRNNTACTRVRARPRPVG